ncbi:SctD/MshK family protein [Aeromonas sp. 164P]
MANWCVLLTLTSALVAPLKDPTTPLIAPPVEAGAAVAAPGLPRLQSIVLGHGAAVVQLNGERYQHGDRVAGWRISRIQADRVMLERGQQRVTLILFGDAVMH